MLRLSLLVLPVAFVVGSWLYADGLPYYHDANETFASYLHARNLVTWPPHRIAWLTSEVTDPHYVAAVNLYTHNPNGPRYAHYLLLLTGIEGIRTHALILGALGALVFSWCLWGFWQSAAPGRAALWGVAPLALVLDPIGGVPWLTNTYRLWTFVLLWACLWTVVARRPFWLGILTFVLFQYEYGTALFVGTAMTMLGVLLHRRGAVALIAASFVGAVLSLALFGAQVWSVLGWDGLVAEVAGTALRRGAPGQEAGIVAMLRHAMRGAWETRHWVDGVAYGQPLGAVLDYGLVSAPFALLRSCCPVRRRLAMLTLSLWAGVAASATLLWGYFSEGFIGSSLPMAVFLIGPSLAAVALDGARAFRWPVPVVGAVVLALFLVVAMPRFRPPMDGAVYRLLSGAYHGQVTVTSHPLTIHVTTLTDAATIPTGGPPWIAPEQRERVNRSRPAEGGYYLVCIAPQVARFGDPTRGKEGKILDPCQETVVRSVWQGDEVADYGLGWVILRVAH